MSTRFKISDDFRGELILPTLEYKMLGSGDYVHLSDQQLKNPHIRMAIRVGTLVQDDAVTEEIEGLSINEILDEIENETVEPVVEEPVAKKKRGRKPKVTAKEKTNPNPKANKPEETEIEEEITIDLDEVRPSEPKTNMSSWNPEDGKMIDKDASMKKVMSDLNGVEMTVQKSSNENTVDFEKELAETTNAIKNNLKKKVPTMNKVAKKKTGKKSKKLKPIGQKKDLARLDESLSNEGSMVKEENILFVDAEQEKERASKRPL